MDAAVEAEYAQEVAFLNVQQHPEAGDILKTLLCQVCSPYAAHIYDAEEDPTQVRTLPGLCTDFCHRFYDTVSSALVSPATGAGNILTTVSQGTQQEVCSLFSITDTVYCYPDLKTNPELNGDIDREAITADGCLCLEQFADQLRNPISFETPPDLSGRVFISEQVGVVHVYHKNGTKRDTPFMDITNQVFITDLTGDERGFLGLTFHPDFVNNQRLIVFFSIRNANSKHTTRISEFRVSDHDPNLVNYTSERVILDLEQPYANHNGGEVCA